MDDKKGNGYILSCVLMIFICSLVSVLLTYSAVVHTIGTSRKDTRTVLDNYVTADSVAIFDALKNSSDNISTVNADIFNENLSAYCGLEKNGNFLYCYSDGGTEKYRISEPQLNFVTDEQLKLRVTYEITVPLRLFDTVITEITVPITIDSLYNNKF